MGNLRMATRRPGYDPSPVGFIPPSELSESELDNIKENFVMFDKDGDGTITTSELMTVLHALGFNPSQSDVDDLLNLFDTDGSGSLSFAEFCDVMVMCKKDVVTDEIIREAFITLDRDGNGTVSLSELKEIMLNTEGNSEKLTEDECHELFAELDSNKDGVLQLAEITKYIRGR